MLYDSIRGSVYKEWTSYAFFKFRYLKPTTYVIYYVLDICILCCKRIFKLENGYCTSDNFYQLRQSHVMKYLFYCTNVWKFIFIMKFGRNASQKLHAGFSQTMIFKNILKNFYESFRCSTKDFIGEKQFNSFFRIKFNATVQ